LGRETEFLQLLLLQTTREKGENERAFGKRKKVCDDIKGYLSLYSELDGLDASHVFLNQWMGLIRIIVVLSRRGQQEEMEIRELHLLWTIGSAWVGCDRWMGC
jgi:hypothetical protein